MKPLAAPGPAARSKIARLARILSPTQRHAILRFSEAQEWGSEYGMGRTWPDIVAGRRGCQFRSIQRLINLGLADRVEIAGHNDLFRLTPLGLSVQLEVRSLERRS
jgi:hypothetical protein